jgi:hypothetical protein
VKIETSSEAADLGTAFHAVISQKVKGVAVDVAEVAAANGVDREELATVVGIGMAMWQKLEKHFPDPVSEHSFEPFLAGKIEVDGPPLVQLTGTGDLLSLTDNGSVVRLLDWKSGWGDADHEAQVKGYALLALYEIPTADRVVASVMKVRRGILETYEWSRAELEMWWADLFSRMLSEADVYRPSPEACGYCPLFAECPARTAMLAAALVMLDANDEQRKPLTSTPDGVAYILERARWVEKAAKSAIESVRAAVINAGGLLPLTDGRELRIESQVRTEIDFPAGEGVLRQHCGDELGKALSVRKGKSKTDPDKLGVEDIVRAKAARGQKDKAIESLMYELDQAAALKLTTIQRLELTKAPKAIEGEA